MAGQLETHAPGTWPHTGAVLAGGRSRRMGRPKHELRLPDGRTMLEAVAAALTAVCARVVAVGGGGAGLAGIDDRRPGRGPLGGIDALLASGLDTQYLVCPCDLPLITPDLLARLTAPAPEAATCFRVEGETGPRPLPLRIAAAAAPAVTRALDEDRGAVHALLREIEPLVVEVPATDMTALANVNTPQAYAELCRGARDVLQSDDARAARADKSPVAPVERSPRAAGRDR